jgi:hypothetical protein
VREREKERERERERRGVTPLSLYTPETAYTLLYMFAHGCSTTTTINNNNTLTVKTKLNIY